MAWDVEIRSKNVAGYPHTQQIQNWIMNNLRGDDYKFKPFLTFAFLSFYKEEDYNLFRLTEGLNWDLKVTHGLF